MYTYQLRGTIVPLNTIKRLSSLRLTAHSPGTSSHLAFVTVGQFPVVRGTYFLELHDNNIHTGI